MKISVRCTCGSDQFVLDDLDNPGQPPRPGSRVKCNACGEAVRLPELQEVTKSAEKLVADRLRDGLKKR